MKLALSKIFVLSLALTLIYQAKAVSETELVAAVLTLEAGGEPAHGMEAVYEVITNRAVKHHQTKLQVVNAHNKKYYAFSCLNIGIPLAIQKAKIHSSWPKAVEIVTANKPTNLTYGATFYDNVKAFGKPWWSKSMKQTVTIGHHVFFAE